MQKINVSGSVQRIVLGNEVVVSDPCYELPTWCQKVVEDVMPGAYDVRVIRSDEDEWGVRNVGIIVIHEKFFGKNKRWNAISYNIGVDSGQAGIFDSSSYRNDKIFEGLRSKFADDFPVSRSEENGGDHWYTHMCDRTLHTEESWGTYDSGVVTSSGIGDGCYTLSATRSRGKIVGLMINFGFFTQKGLVHLYQDSCL